ncbi:MULTISPECIES: transcriptional repressor LexA [Thiorhodovibrio]|uniref:transcriptional repressor LexA n=1 Tax=Thiorhodovibrio TaxID=61593 RepID=UPI0019130DFF|nr:transcriptional repressor LexA [Thiorhodovibrio litoralis]MBK5969907.1 repressor LexA [Thiorhodovibrio winogradskyi]WPL12048.1 LexA repressor [Thiorhodovibrio litoralis]
MSEPVLTDRQRQILALIRRHIRETGYPPTRAEIAAACGFRSVNAAVDHLKALARRGVIELKPGASRGIRLLESAASVSRASRALSDSSPDASAGLPMASSIGSPMGLPLIGRVAAGRPLLALEHIEDHYPVDPGLFRPRADYLLRVSGESMRDAGILDGDLLAVQRRSEARNGQVLVVRVDDEVTVKRFQQSEDHPHRVQLLPANPDFDPIEIDLRAQELMVEGLGVGVLRRQLTVASQV